MDIREIRKRIGEPLFNLRRYMDQASFIMQDVLEDYFYIEEEDKQKLGFMLTYAFKRAGSKAGIVDDALRQLDAQLKALEALEKEIDKAIEAAKKEAAA